MSTPRIAIFGNRGSRQVAAFRDALLEAGATPLLFNIQLGEASGSRISVGEDRLFWEGVDFSSIDAIHIRCTAPNTLPAMPPLLNAASYSDWRGDYLKEQFFQAATRSFFEQFSRWGKLLINPLTAAYIDHDTKAQLYEKLRAEGFMTPATMTTNDPDRARDFIGQHHEVVVKPSIGVGSTRVITREDCSRLEELRLCPVMMQERISGNTLRVHIVGDSVVLALRIISEGGVDSRTETRKFEYICLPEEEEARIIRANRFLGLHYAAWDVIEAEEGPYCYLDCNPGPYIMWIGSLFVRVVFRELAAYSIAYTRTGSVQYASAQVTPWRPEGA